ncbi:FKBP-type peptidyl-prolyl cis-trans isomerase [Microbacterium sp. zg.Y1090]|uniref:FKBP-type peptidyl-prolyl cis-trans isomerase n=1 Tax=Microbacterium TaxID=33882 RepID=UPI00214C08D3|nr:MULTISPECIES: FKBP-type peptidyl-prolyl cis-trans isomerase [unclassified Microbacterium]MCR2813459.1 FKBP-type peptidyl-prolyl cis-trans isomerase [Microbacterium sp. zg.Y1084]MCR2818205.1 FKBP-type peptidyl-prolyl cis-trans isomerase [Microbacterium sp. zg.Y1090]MDL5486726.1 FKBP-type peptidyl-prolyl cis-trans isomerase [Microbacterium sp. zg-Y1211]WIM27646.1 FKBP-type peptidyl-prolyl cis-trans isomerase [Microbacterium sp. zg-Y1090]
MRFRPLAALSVAAVSALLLAGCAGSPDTTGTPSSEDSALCDAKLDSGAASDAVKAEGAVGELPEVTFSTPLEIDEMQSTLLVEGDGEAVSEGDLVNVAFVGLDAADATELGSVGYTEGEVLPQTIGAETGIGQFLGCAPVGSRVAVALPADDTTGTSAQVYVLDLIDIVPAAAWGEEQEPAEGLPTVELDEDGAPTVTLPEGDAPTEYELAVLKEGDGPTVAEGDAVMVQYQGVSWDTGEVFDQSWGQAPATFSTSQVVQGFADALVGQKVGSQVIAVLPPAVAYGEGEINDENLVGQTLVFVVDILGTQHVPTQ